MLKLFGKKKKPKEDPVELQLENKIYQLINKHFSFPSEVEKISFTIFTEHMTKIKEGMCINLFNGSDTFQYTIIFNSYNLNADEFRKELFEISTFEVLQTKWTQNELEETLWSFDSKEIYSPSNKSFFLIENTTNNVPMNNNSIHISKSGEFELGKLLISNVSSKKLNVALSYDSINFHLKKFDPSEVLIVESQIEIDKKIYKFYYQFRNTFENKNNQLKKYLIFLCKNFLKEQQSKFEYQLEKKVQIKNMTFINEMDLGDRSHFSLSGIINGMPLSIAYELIFPKSFLNLFPDFICTTIKGRIIQINKMLFRKEFKTHYRYNEDFLFTEFLSVLTNRDLNLINQNFLISHKIVGDQVRQLFYYKILSDEKPKMAYVPIVHQENFIKHLPLKLREDFKKGQSYAKDYDELKRKNNITLGLIYKDLKEGKLLLSYKAKTVLDREIGSTEKENTMKRLKQLVGNKKFINILSTLNQKNIQLLFSNIKNKTISDTFIYQTDELSKIKPYLSSRKFNELKEDVFYTQGKIKTNQIDINRICESIENFNGAIKDFLESEKEKESKE